MSAAEVTEKERVWKDYYGPNLGYIQEQYEQYVNDPESVEANYRDLFARFGPPPASIGSQSVGAAAPVSLDGDGLNKVVSSVKLAGIIRTFGHLAADIDPLGINPPVDTRRFEPETYGLTRADLEALPASIVLKEAPAGVHTCWDAIEHLRAVYTRSIAYEFRHVHDEEELKWLRRHTECLNSPEPLTPAERVALLKRLIEVEQFETFLHRTFVGQKRFSIEGTDVLVPMLDELVRASAANGTQHILMGMAHRGRLNVLAHVLGKPYGKIFSEFHHSPNKDLFPSEGSMGINYGWTGDVKYHLGADRSVTEGNTVRTKVTLANNPSHLEYVNPVVEGFSRAAQDDRSQPGYPRHDTGKAATVLMHGDAAFPGEGIVSETLNFNKLRGFQNGGTLHIIVNNRIGFTTKSEDSRSTHYASDLAKGFEIPIVHVNADDPDACIAAVRMAVEYRSVFKKDFLIDLIGYRRHGHNEMDDPEGTSPFVYRKVNQHPTVYALYGERLKQEGLVGDAQIEQMKKDAEAVLQQAYDKMKETTDRAYRHNTGEPPSRLSGNGTAVPLEQLREINRELLLVPEGFQVYPKLQRILQRRANALDEGEKVDWALAETLAFATILAEGQPIRITGQDSERGTFSQRHLVLHDYKTGETFSPLHRIPQAKASFAIYNSPLSEASVLGYEYGYNVFAPETLVIWEAQYGDFANAAQVIFDQFIAAGRAKWNQKSNLVVLLPHGFEGQGPEHSSARLERFLQSSAEHNWTVVNLTSAAQYFHLLRRQAAIGGTDEARPLIVMAPKSLLRNPRSASPGREFSEGHFHPVWDEAVEGQQPKKVERLILATGKMAIDLQTELETSDRDHSWLHMIRVEQLYPFPQEEIAAIIERYPALKEIVWVQEEPKNMGAWTYMEPRIREVAPKKVPVHYIGRPEHSSPASGYADVHSFEQRQIITESFASLDKN